MKGRKERAIGNPSRQFKVLLRLIVLLCPPFAPGGLGQLKAQSPAKTCQKLTLTGEVAAGQEWKASIGEGWTFRFVPISAPISSAQSQHNGQRNAPYNDQSYSGWDLVVDQADHQEYPDALLLATPPYSSLSEREIGTTFGMRAQDAIAWNRRRFHFLTSANDLARSKTLYQEMMRGRAAGQTAFAGQAELLSLVERASPGELQILDAKLTAGVADPPSFARQWAMHLGEVPHTLVPASGMPSARGALLGIRFKASLWLPATWKTGNLLHIETAKCAE
ncbi:hypothetical protein [Acidicapsa ligni]|uniref:hypothetical protein n=1 Tax=Acidicapsa ligni TaxID=542300 RepID=UPI0021DF7825|nr:hypothetical protein [Acidicapsa ligni]